MNLNLKQKPATKPHREPCTEHEELRCKNVDDYYGDMICRCVSQSGGTKANT